jgi:hypothetical protein
MLTSAVIMTEGYVLKSCLGTTALSGDGTPARSRTAQVHMEGQGHYGKRVTYLHWGVGLVASGSSVASLGCFPPPAQVSGGGKGKGGLRVFIS